MLMSFEIEVFVMDFNNLAGNPAGLGSS